LNTSTKILQLSGTDGRVAIVGNFGVETATTTGVFPEAGDWYNYFSGETINLTDANAEVTLEPGDFRLYLTNPIERMAGQLPVSLNDREVARLQLQVSPNPT